MTNQQTLEQLYSMKLSGIAQALEQQYEQPQTHELSFDERLSLLIDREQIYRENRRLSRLLKAAKLRVPACIEEINYRHRRGLEKSTMAQLASCEWVRSGHNLCITGPTGCGKTWLSCALGNQAC
ncbi:MAG: ATP-binding protein, partial [Gammaproteobacteria bacterium]|nr:ATP-binding protein [Gammaproteobacteria bacterium]